MSDWVWLAFGKSEVVTFLSYSHNMLGFGYE